MPSRPPVLYAAATLAVLLAAPLRAADDPLDAFPAETGVVLRLASPTDLTGKVKAFLGNAAPQFAPVADQLGPGLGSLIGNPTLAGIDADRPWYVAVLPRAEGAPAVLFAAPAADAAALKKAVGQGYQFADHENWVIYSLDAEAVKKVQTRLSGQGKAIREALVGSAGELFGKGEVAAFLNVPILREAYKPQIEQAKEQLAKSTQTPADAPPAVKAGMEYNRRVLEAALKAVDDIAAISTHLVIGDASLNSETLVAVAPGTRSAEFLAKQTPSDFPLLAKLPRGRVAYYGMAGDLSDLIAASTQMTAGLYPQNDELKKRTEELKTFEFSEVVGLFELGDLEGGVYRGVTVAKVDQPEKYLALAREMVKAMGHVETPGLQQDVTVQPEAETIEGVKVDLVKMVMTPDPNSDPTGMSQKILDVFFGKDGLTQRMAVVDGLFVQAAGDAAVMKTAIKAARGQAEGDEAAAKAADSTRAELGGKGNLFVVFDLPRLLAEGLRLAIESNQIPLPFDAQAVRDLELTPSYTGTTVSAGANEVRIRGVVPAAQVRGTVDLFRVLQQAAPGRNRAQ